MINRNNKRIDYLPDEGLISPMDFMCLDHRDMIRAYFDLWDYKCYIENRISESEVERFKEIKDVTISAGGNLEYYY